MNRKTALRLAAIPAAVLATMPAMAAIDTVSALAGVTDAQTALLALLGGFIGLSAAIFGVTKVYGFLRKKAGA